jgi:hypothetical protein
VTKVGLLPTKIDKLGRAEPVPESDQDHRRVLVALPLSLAASMRRSTSAGVRCSRVRSNPVRWTAGGATSRSCALFRFRADELQAHIHEKILPFGPTSVRKLPEKRTAVETPFHHERARSVAFFGPSFARISPRLRFSSGRSLLRRSKRALVSLVEKGGTEHQSMRFGAQSPKQHSVTRQRLP